MKLILFIVAASTLLGAQAPVPTPDVRRFEVVSVKRSPPPANPNERIVRPGSVLTVTAAIAFAYQIEPNRIVGAPQWASEERYEINARVPEGVNNPPTLAELEARPVLFTALPEQLGLKLGSDTAPMDVVVFDSVDRPMPD